MEVREEVQEWERPCEAGMVGGPIVKQEGGGVPSQT